MLKPVETEAMQEHRRKQQRVPSNKRVSHRRVSASPAPLRLVTVEEPAATADPAVGTPDPALSPFHQVVRGAWQAVQLLAVLLRLLRREIGRFYAAVCQTVEQWRLCLIQYLEGGTAIIGEAAAMQAERAMERAAVAPRLSSLDAFRGLAVLAMLLVNNATPQIASGNLIHADWSGSIHIADLVFPYFLFIVGAAIPYSWASHRRGGAAQWQYLLRAARRTVILILLGCLLDSTITRQLTFDLGVLQLIGLAYLVGALLVHLRPLRRLGYAAGLLLLHSAIIRFVPIPGVGAGHFAADENIIGYINDNFLQQWGLKGLLSVLPTGALVLMGSVVGELLRRENYIRVRKLPVLAVGGALLLLLGWIWSASLPFNKPVWTASYILYTTGGAMLMLGLLYALIDIRGWRAAAFVLVVPGMNAILLYVGSILFKINILQTWHWYQSDGRNPLLEKALQERCSTAFGQTAGGWMYTLGYIGFWWIVLFYLYRRRIFLRV